MRLWVCFVLAATACTKPNPASCADGTCTDPSLPFCDVGGEVAGTPEACIAVACDPGVFEVCRGDVAITCNTAGTDFDLVQCEFGCEAATGGCKQCASSSTCPTEAPFCDPATNACRVCSVDDECASTACNVDDGTCFAESELVFASPAAIDANAPCSQAAPCSLSRAVTIAGQNPLRSTIRMLPGTYDSKLNLIDTTLSFIGTGATLNGNGPDVVLVGDAADVTIRGLTLDLSRGALRCDPSPGTIQPVLKLRDLTINEPTGESIILLSNCKASMVRVEVQANVRSFFAIGGSDVDGIGILDMDQCHIKNTASEFGFFTLTGASGNVRITNSVFEDVESPNQLPRRCHSSSRSTRS